jgi:hypothetical protein
MEMSAMPTFRLPGAPLHRVACAALIVAAEGGFAPRAHADPGTTTVEALQLPAWVQASNGQRRPADPGMPLRAGDKAISGAGSRLLLRMGDGSVIRLGEQTEFLIRSLDTHTPGVAMPSEQKGAFKLAAGTLRYTTDPISLARGNRRELGIELATASAHAQGTDIWSQSNADQDAVFLLDGKAEVVRDAKPAVVLDKPGALWNVYTGEREKPADQATPAQWAKFLAQTDLQAGGGVLLQGGRWRTVAATLNGAAEANALQARLQAAGYPAQTKAKDGRHEVRINQLATREDAEALLKRLRSDPALGVTEGRAALAAQ